MVLKAITFTDRFNLPENEIIRLAEDLTKKEAKEKSWTDWSIVTAKKPEKISDRETRYFFEVTGY